MIYILINELYCHPDQAMGQDGMGYRYGIKKRYV